MVDFDNRIEMSPIGTRWFKFYILVALILQILVLAMNIYSSYKDFDFIFSGGLSTTPTLFNFLSIIYLLSPIATVILVILARMKCKRFELKGYFLLQISIWMGFFNTLIYTLVINYSEIFVNTNSAEATGLFVGLFLYSVPSALNSYYFKKRKFLFNN